MTSINGKRELTQHPVEQVSGQPTAAIQQEVGADARAAGYEGNTDNLGLTPDARSNGSQRAWNVIDKTTGDIIRDTPTCR